MPSVKEPEKVCTEDLSARCTLTRQASLHVPLRSKEVLEVALLNPLARSEFPPPCRGCPALRVGMK